MRKQKKKQLSVRKTQAFKELVKDLRKQVPDKQKKLQEMLDEVIAEETPEPKEK